VRDRAHLDPVLHERHLDLGRAALRLHEEVDGHARLVGAVDLAPAILLVDLGDPQAADLTDPIATAKARERGGGARVHRRDHELAGVVAQRTVAQPHEHALLVEGLGLREIRHAAPAIGRDADVPDELRRALVDRRVDVDRDLVGEEVRPLHQAVHVLVLVDDAAAPRPTEVEWVVGTRRQQ
jgi:hypothetical protein